MNLEMSSLRSLGRKVAAFSLLVALPLLAFAIPPIVANNLRRSSWVLLVIGALAYLLTWLLALVSMLDAAGSLYPINRPFFVGARLRGLTWIRLPEKRVGSFVASAFTSYLLTLYGFAVAYSLTSNLSPDAFNTGKPLSFFTALYYAVVTAATVGFGDISPQSDVARAITMVEIIIAFLYAVFIFGAIVGQVLHKDSDK